MSVTIDQLNGLEPGLYIFHWENGKTSDVAVCRAWDGVGIGNWIAPTDWIKPPCRITNDIAAEIASVDRIVKQVRMVVTRLFPPGLNKIAENDIS